MPRYKLTVEYDGTSYAGWQRQAGLKTVQGAIEAAVKAFCGEEVALITAGRTDAGVHARGAVAHLDLGRPLPPAAKAQPQEIISAPQAVFSASAESGAPSSLLLAGSAASASRFVPFPSVAQIPSVSASPAQGALHPESAPAVSAEKLQAALNAHLRLAGEAVAILAAEIAADDFNARFSAVKRHYLYRILNRRAPAVLEKNRVWWLPYRLNAAKMDKAAQCLLGRHDFTTFHAAQCQAESPIRTLDRLEVRRKGEYIEIKAEARSFLHNQIRSIVGSLAEVGRGKWAIEDMRAALEAKSRARCGQVAPACGLYLMRVDYPETDII